MKYNLIIALAAYCLVSLSCSTTQNSYSNTEVPSFNGLALPPPSKNGECYTKYTYKDQYTSQKKSYAIYTGDETKEDVEIQTKTIIIKPANSKWVKKKKSEDCVSNNPNDCYVACLEETPAQTETIKILKDTTQSPNFISTQYVQEVLTSKGGNQEWIKTMCEKQLTRSFISELQAILQSKSYYSGDISGSLTSETREGLMAYQKENGMKVGYLDLATMNSLGLEVK